LSFRVNIEMYSSYLNLFNGGVVPLTSAENTFYIWRKTPFTSGESQS
jgi:hypothetical protein